ncbi:hypothetical protein BDD12DRAFT_810380 [Trichophaea hybrida]|nr:hypothetical protein BDD12DRAFT_810380 [Trichophaea hybrida]
MSLDSIKIGGAGHKSSVKVRLLHAVVRKRKLKLHAENPGYYNLQWDGIPINDLDLIVTILSFSASLVWVSLPRQGLFLRNQEALSSPELAKAYAESFLLTEINPTPSSQVLSQNIISSLAGHPPSYPSSDYLVATARWLNGEDLVDAFGLPTPSLKARALVFAQCVFVCGFCYVFRSIPYLDRKKVTGLRRVFYRMIVEGKTGLGGEAGFEFQYVPQVNTKTEARKVDMREKWDQGVERRNMKVLVVIARVAGVVVIVGFWMFMMLLRMMY